MRRLSVGTVGLALFACSRPGPLPIDLPIDPGTHAVLLASEPSMTNGAPALDRIIALDPEVAPPPGLLPVVARSDLGRGSRFTALLYTESLDRLGIKTGTIAVVDPQHSDFSRARTLPPPSGNIYEAVVTNDEGPRWNTIKMLGSNLDQVRIQSPHRCQEFSGKLIALPGGHGYGALAYAVWLADLGLFLAGTSDGDPDIPHGLEFLIDPTSTASAAPRVVIDDSSFSPPPPFTPQAVFVSPTQELWMADKHGRLARARVTRTSTGVAITVFDMHIISDALELESIDGGMTDRGLELFMTARQGALLRYEDATHSLSEVAAYTPARMPGDLTPEPNVTVAWDGPGRAVLVGNGDKRVHRFHDGQLTDEAVSMTPIGELKVLRRIPGLGVVVSSVTGELFVDDGSGWRLLANSDHSFPILAFEPYEGGFLFGGASGAIGQWYPDIALCAIRSVASDEVTHIAVGGGWVLLGGVHKNGAPDLVVTLAKPVPELR